MKKNLLLNLFSCLMLVACLFTFSTHPAFAQITNPAINGALGNDYKAAESGSTFTSFFITLWRVVIFIGVLALLFNFINGALEWIMAGGESGKIQKGRDKIVQSVIGMIVLATSFVVIQFISQLFFGSNFDLLKLTIPTITSTTTPAAP